jgi:heat shock factor-binding protein 1
MKIQKTSSSTSSKSSSSHHAGNLKSSSTESNQSNHFETNFDTFDEPAAVDQQEEEEIDLNIFVSDLLDQMTSRFDNVSKSILNRIDAMGDRIDDLEKNINELVLSGEGQKVGTRGSASGGAIGLDAQGETI